MASYDLPIYQNIDLNTHQLKGFSPEQVAVVPPTPFAGQLILMTAANGGLLADHLYIRNSTNTAWVDLTSISGIVLSDFAAGVIDTDVTLAANSDAKLATQKAIKAYVDAVATSVTSLVGPFDASAGLLPTTGVGGGAIKKGNRWQISVGGTIAGVGLLDVFDELVANKDNASVAADFYALEGNKNAATTTTGGYVTLATEAETKAKTNATKAVTPSDLLTFARQKVVSFNTDGTSTNFTVIHSLGIELTNLQVQLRDGTTNREIIAPVDKSGSNTTNQFDVNISPARPTGTINVIITHL